MAERKYKVVDTNHPELKAYKGQVGEYVSTRPVSDKRQSDYDIIRIRINSATLPFFRYELEEVKE
jgi:hypothetical protein